MLLLQATTLLIAHLHASHGPYGVSFWLDLPHVAAGFGWGRATAHSTTSSFYHFFQMEA
jgi:hypothetical protein